MTDKKRYRVRLTYEVVVESSYPAGAVSSAQSEVERYSNTRAQGVTVEMVSYSAQAIEARRAIDAGGGVVGDESAVPQECAQPGVPNAK